MAGYLLREQVEAQYDAVASRMEQLGAAANQPQDSDANRSDIALTWQFIQEKYEEGMAISARKPLEGALQAIARLDAMLDAAQSAAANPFAETDPALGNARAAALEGLSDDAQAARRRLLDTFNQLDALRTKLEAQFGEEGVPLAIRLGLSATQNKLDAAVDAAPGDLPGFADDAEAVLEEVQRAARDLLAAAQKWAQDHEAFRVRYLVMQAHPKKGDVEFVKPEFDKITQAYDTACAKAAAHEYEAASQDISVVRHDLKDALDFADDCATFDALHAERTQLLATLPAPDSYKVENLKDDDIAARELLTGAVDLRRDGQMAAALAQLNRIVGAVDDILDAQRFATQHQTFDRRCGRILDKLAADYDADVKSLLADEVASATTAREAAQADADRGEFRSAAGQALYLLMHLRTLIKTAAYLKDYITERQGLAGRLAETEGKAGPEGRIAIKGYFEALKANEAKRAAAEAAGDYKTANAMCLRLKDEHAEMMDRADAAKAYLAEKATYDTELARLAELGGTVADAARATAAEMLASAVEATTIGNWLGGTSLLRNAVLEIRRGISDAETAAVIDGLQDSAPKLADPDTDIESAIAAFEKIKTHVMGLDTDGDFLLALVDIEEKAQNARDVVAADRGAAQKSIDEAIADCRAIARQLTVAASFADHLKNTETLIAEAETANADNILDDDIAKAKLDRDAANTAMEEPRLDFEGGIRKLGEAQATARAALAAMVSYNARIKTAWQTLSDALNRTREDAVRAYMTSYADRLQGILDDMNAAFDARNIPVAEAKATEGEEYAQSIGTVHAECLEATTYKATKIDGKFRDTTMTHPTTVSEVAEINRLLDIMNGALRDGQFATALYNGKKARSQYFAARRKAQAVDAYLPIKTACLEKLTALEDRTSADAGPLSGRVEALRMTFDRAVTQEDTDNYHGAQKRLTGFVAACEELSGEFDVFDRCVLHKSRGQAALEEVGRNRIPAIEPLYARLEGKNENAKRKMAAHDFKSAGDFFRELEAEAAGAMDAKGRVENLEGTLDGLWDDQADGAETLLAAISNLTALLNTQKAEPSAMYVHPQIMAVEAQLQRAAGMASEDLDAAKGEFQTAVGASTDIVTLMAQYDQLNQSAVLARTLGQSLLEDHPVRAVDGHKDFAVAEIEDRLAALEVSMHAARQSESNRPQTQADIEEIIAAFRDLQAVLDTHVTYAKARAPHETAHAELEKDPLRHVIREVLTKARRHLDTAATRAADRDHASAMTELNAAGITLDLAKLQVMLTDNRPIMPQDVQSILATPDGLDMLDEVVAALPPSVQREVMAVAFSARFGCTLEMMKPGAAQGDDPQPENQMNLPAPNLRRFYHEMSKLPQSDTLDNDSMLIFMHQSGNQEGSAYSPSGKKVLMREGDESRSAIYGIAVEHELGQTHEKATPKPGQERTMFSWNTLHEVGHAVDDKLGYMRQHGEALAGWKVYGADVSEPAAEIAGKYSFDANYVAEYMLSSEGRNLPIPAPDGCDAEEWRRRMQDCRAFVDRARNGNNPWSSKSVADACVVGDYTYVESYSRNWARYRSSERAFGVSGYQFRAPGEWFSELYAAYHSDRLNDSHPHRSVIADL